MYSIFCFSTTWFYQLAFRSIYECSSATDMLAHQPLGSSYLINSSSVPSYTPIDLMTGLPVQPAIVADTIRLHSNDIELAVEKPFFISNFFLSACRIPLKSQFPGSSKLQRIITPYRPLLFPLSEMLPQDRYEFLLKFPPGGGRADAIYIFLQRRWRRISNVLQKHLRGVDKQWIEEREIIRNGYTVPPQHFGVYIPSPFASLWYHVDHTLFESMIGYEQVFNRSLLQENFIKKKMLGERYSHDSGKSFHAINLPASLHSENPLKMSFIPRPSLSGNISMTPSKSLLANTLVEVDYIEKLKRFSIVDVYASLSPYTGDTTGKPSSTCPLANLCRTRCPVDPSIPWWVDEPAWG